MTEFILGLLLNIIVGWFFYWLGSRSSRKIVREIVREVKIFIEAENRHAASLRDALKTLEGKVIEGGGRILVERDDEGNPFRLRIAQQTVGGVPSDEQVGTFIEPPPTPPEIIRGRASIGGEANVRVSGNVRRVPWWRRWFKG